MEILNTSLFIMLHFYILCAAIFTVYCLNNKTSEIEMTRTSQLKESLLNLSTQSQTKNKKTDTKVNEKTNIDTSNNNSSCQISESELTPEDQRLFKSLRDKGLYYSLQSVIEDINFNKFKTGIVDLMHVHNRSEWISKMRRKHQARDQIRKKKRMIFINIETVYSSKREMITKAVARRLRGRHMTTPPKFMADIRMIIGSGSARKLYYSLTKYSSANHIKHVLTTHPVVLEKYWMHHAAFTIGKAFNETDLPARGHPIYKWPKDLLAPDILFFVNATKNTDGTGFKQLYTDFTDRLIQVYRRVEGVNIVELNPNQNYLNIVKYIINYLKKHFKNHPEIVVPDPDFIKDVNILR